MVRVLIIYLVFLAFVASGQEVRFEQITNESGRSLGWVTGMVQDSTGFMWLTTRNGLYRYDGYSYKFFRSKHNDSTSIPHNDITYLYLDREKRLWMRHYNKLFAFVDEKLTYHNDYFKNNTFDINTDILQDKFGDYWVGPVKESIIRVKHDGSAIDTFSLAHQLVHPGIVNWLRKTKPMLFTSKTDTLNVKEAQDFMIASCGEGTNGNFYDYTTITKNGEVVFDARDSFNPIVPNSLFMLSNTVITLEPGEYHIHFTSDEENSFKKGYNPFKQYGVALYPVKKESEIAKLAQVKYYPEKSIHAQQIKTLQINEDGHFTLLADNGIHVFKEDGWHSTTIDFDDYLGFVMQSDSYIMPLIQGKQGHYWIGCHKGLFQIVDGMVTEHILFDQRISLYNIMQDHDQNIWLATGQGLYKYDPKSRKTIQYKQNNENRLYSNRIWDVLEDRSHNIWIATTRGLNRLRPSKFKYDNLGMKNYAPFPILGVGHDKYMTGGQSNELIYFSVNNQKKKSFQIPDSIFPTDSYDISDIMLVRNRLYITYSNRVAVFNYPTLDLIRYVEIPDIQVSDQEVDNHSLYIIPSANHVWVVGLTGLYRFGDDLESDSVALYFGNSFEKVLDVDNRYVKDIEQWENDYFLRTAGHIWKFSPGEAKLQKLASFPENIYQTALADGNGFIDRKEKKLWFSMVPEIYRMDIETGSIDTFRIDLNIDLGNCNTSVHDSLVWISTSNGLIRFNYEAGDFILYNSSDGLADNNVNATYKDTYNQLWITSMKGLTKMDIRSEETETYFRSNDFIQLRFLEPHYRHPQFEHQLVLPTTTGYLRFNPDSLNPFKPPMVISAIYLFGKETNFDSLSYKKQHIELPFNKNFITFELASLDYTEPSKNIFRYKMENFNDQWIYTDANDRKAPYTGLPPGSYVFVAQGTNNDGVWGKPLRISVVIHPPWYRTLTAYISYVIFTILSIVLFIRYRERKLKEEKRILEQKVRERTAEISRQRDEIAAQKKDITDSIHYASRIQSALLPSDEFVGTLLSSYFILFKPRDIVSGDYYWLTQIRNQTIVVAADCTGHGVPGAFMSMLGVAFLNEIVVRDKTISANEILDRLREYVIKSLKQTGKEGGSKDGMDVALAIINHDEMEAEFSGAYNPLYVLRDNEIITIKADRMPIGYHIKIGTPFSKKTVALQKGDRLYMFSDGYPDQFGGKDGRKFMSKRFKEELIETGHLSMEDQKNALNKTIEEWRGDNYDQIDDILVIGLEI